MKVLGIDPGIERLGCTLVEGKFKYEELLEVLSENEDIQEVCTNIA